MMDTVSIVRDVVHMGARGIMLEYLTAWRQYKVLTQAQLATEAGVTRKTVSRAEHGGAVDAATVRKLAKALRISPRQLSSAPPPASPPQQTRE